MTATSWMNNCCRSTASNSLRPTNKTGSCRPRMAGHCGAIKDAGRSSGSLRGCSTSAGWSCAMNTMRKTFKALSTSLRQLFSAGIYEMASSMEDKALGIVKEGVAKQLQYLANALGRANTHLYMFNGLQDNYSFLAGGPEFWSYTLAAHAG